MSWEAPSLRGVLSGEREGGSRGAVDRGRESLGPVGKRHCLKRLCPERKVQGTGRCGYPGDVGDEAAGPLLVAADLQGLDVMRRAVAGDIDCRQGLVEGEGKNLQNQGSQHKATDEDDCPVVGAGSLRTIHGIPITLVP
jgi:hypothetical protein